MTDCFRFAGAVLLSIASLGAHATPCGSANYPFPYTDVAPLGDAFCPGILQAYVLGVTKGTSPTTFSPNQDVTRVQMTTFLQRSQDQTLRRASRRMALGQWWNQMSYEAMQKVALPPGRSLGLCKSDGTSVWVANGTRIQSVRAATGQVEADLDMRVQQTDDLFGILVMNGRLTLTDPIARRVARAVPSKDPPYLLAGFSYDVPFAPNTLTFDGTRLWFANYDDGTIFIMNVTNGAPALTGSLVGGFSRPTDVVYDGQNVWVSEAGTANRISKLDANGAILQSVPVGTAPAYMAFDGANLWVPNFTDGTISVVQAATGAVVATIQQTFENGLFGPLQAAFDGERILITSHANSKLQLFRAADLAFLGRIDLPAGALPFGVCSDGVNFWVTLRGLNILLRV